MVYLLIVKRISSPLYAVSLTHLLILRLCDIDDITAKLDFKALKQLKSFILLWGSKCSHRDVISVFSEGFLMTFLSCT